MCPFSTIFDFWWWQKALIRFSISERTCNCRCVCFDTNMYLDAVIGIIFCSSLFLLLRTASLIHACWHERKKGLNVTLTLAVVIYAPNFKQAPAADSCLMLLVFSFSSAQTIWMYQQKQKKNNKKIIAIMYYHPSPRRFRGWTSCEQEDSNKNELENKPTRCVAHQYNRHAGNAFLHTVCFDISNNCINRLLKQLFQSPSFSSVFNCRVVYLHFWGQSAKLGF